MLPFLRLLSHSTSPPRVRSFVSLHLSAMSTPATAPLPPPVPSAPGAGAGGSNKSSRHRHPRHRARPAATSSSASGPEGTATTTASSANSTNGSPSRIPEGHWRGGARGGRGGSTRGNGARGGATSGGRRAFTTQAGDAGGVGAVEELGKKVEATRLDDQSAATASTASTNATPRPPLPGQRPPPPAAHSTAAGPTPPKKVNRRNKKKDGKKTGTEEEDFESSSGDDAGPLLRRIARASGEAGDGVLSAEIDRLFEAQRASPSALAARSQLISELTDLLNAETFRWGHSHNPHRHPIRIEPFGSVRFGLATSSSDLDLCLFDPYRPRGFDVKYFSSKEGANTQKLPDIYDMRILGKKLMMAGLSKVTPIPFAGVPIVKFEIQIGDQTIQADINTNERLGVLNSRLIAAYCSLSPLIRPLCIFIKTWARQRALNDPSGQSGPITFSSYTLILLIIAFLQHRGIVPNLQDPALIEALGVEQTRWFSTPKARKHRNGKIGKVQGSTGWDTTFVEDLQGWQGDKGESTESLAKGFFEFYAREFDSTKQVVSISRGGVVPRERRFKLSTKREGEEDDEDDSVPPAPTPQIPWSRSSSPIEFDEFVEPGVWSTKALVVQDPFDLNRNTAGNVEPDIVEALRTQLTRAYTLINTGSSSIDEICQSIKSEPGYKSLQAQRKQWRAKRVNEARIEKQKLKEPIVPVEVEEAKKEEKGEKVESVAAVEGVIVGTEGKEEKVEHESELDNRSVVVEKTE